MNLRTLLSRFRPSKASVEPVSRTDDLGGHTMTLMGASYRFDMSPPAPEVLVKQEPTPFTGIVSHELAGETDLRMPPQHPLAPEPEPPPLDWSVWSRLAQENERRGWSFARYAVKSSTDSIACVFGIVRGAWGICRMDFYICGSGRFDTLDAITHLPSGMGCGLFTDREAAVAACDIASRLADDWETLDPRADHQATGRAFHHMHAAWAAAGLTRCSTHAHATADHDTAPIAIWFQDYNTIVMGRPEKLS